MPKQLLVGYDSPAETLLAVPSAIVLLVALAGLWALITGEAAARAEAPPTGRADAEPGEAGGAAAARRGHAPAGRDEAVLLAALAAAALILPVLAALAGEDHLITRNLLAVAPIGAALAGAGLVARAPLALRRARRDRHRLRARPGRGRRRRDRPAQPA